MSYKPAQCPETPLKTMNLQEARSVMWLRNNYRPLGELLDEGFLTRQRLEWASVKAYNPQLQQAAVVLLDWLDQAETDSPLPTPPTEPSPIIEAMVTLEQARAVHWPFRPFKGQLMGKLVDARQINLGNLAYAIEKAWDERVRQAAIRLIAWRLNQAVKEPAPPAGPLKVLSSGRSYAERRQFLITFIQGIIFGLSSALVMWLGIQFIAGLLSPRSYTSLAEALASPEGIIALLLLLGMAGGAVWLFNRLTDWGLGKLEQESENCRKGQRGENDVAEVMRQNLDGEWTLFRNLTLPGRNQGDVDAVLVGPPGVWALEVKTFSGEYRNVGEHWEVRAGGWKLLKSSPGRQAQNSAVRLANFFKANGFSQWVMPVVVWADRDSPLKVQSPMVAVWTIDDLAEELGNLYQEKTMPEATKSRIIETLTTLCQNNDSENPM